jgi:hypothetical protein
LPISTPVVQQILTRIKVRAVAVVVVIHLGVFAAIYGVATLPRPDGMELSHWLTLGGLGGIYGGMWLAIFFVVWPLQNLVRRIRRLLSWRDWILDELPRILAALPAVLEAIRAFFQSLSKGGTVQSAMSEAATRAASTAASPVPGVQPGMTTAPANSQTPSSNDPNQVA